MTVGRARTAHEARMAWWSTLVAAVLAFAAQLAYSAIDLSTFGSGATLLIALRLVHAIAIAVVIALLLAQVHRPSVSWCTGAFVAMALPFFPIFWLAETQMSALGTPWCPFVGHKILVIGLALLAPVRSGVLVGAVLVALFGVGAIAQWVILDFGRADVVSPGEPWGTAVYSMIALGFLAYRRRHLILEREYALIRAEAAVLERLARVLLVIRDRTNTPLQSLEIATELLSRQLPGEDKLVRQMRDSLARLRDLTRTLAGSDRFVHWTDADAAIDADAFLRQLEADAPRERG